MAQIMAKPRAQEEAEPQAQGKDPGAPRDRGPLGQALEEVAGHALAPRDHPLRDVLIVKLVPVVLRRGVVRRAEEAGDDELSEAHAGDAAGHHQHDVNRDQLRPGQRQPPVQEADGAAGQDEKEEEEERGGGAEVEGQVRPLDRVRRVGVADVEHQAQHRPDEQAPHRDPPQIPCVLPVLLRGCRHRGFWQSSRSPGGRQGRSTEVAAEAGAVSLKESAALPSTAVRIPYRDTSQSRRKTADRGMSPSREK